MTGSSLWTETCESPLRTGCLQDDVDFYLWKGRGDQYRTLQKWLSTTFCWSSVEKTDSILMHNLLVFWCRRLEIFPHVERLFIYQNLWTFSVLFAVLYCNVFFLNRAFVKMNDLWHVCEFCLSITELAIQNKHDWIWTRCFGWNDLLLVSHSDSKKWASKVLNGTYLRRKLWNLLYTSHYQTARQRNVFHTDLAICNHVEYILAFKSNSKFDFQNMFLTRYIMRQEEH